MPGLILFLFGYPLIVGWWSILLLPISLALYAFLRLWQDRQVFRRLGVDVGNNARGFIGTRIETCPTRRLEAPGTATAPEAV